MDTKNVSVIIPDHLSHTGDDYRREIPIDEPIADIVERLNHPAHGDDAFTVASCAHCLANVSMLDGRTLAVFDRFRDFQIASLALGLDNPGDSPMFELHRDEDPTGVSGTGIVAHGWAIDRRYVIRWHGEYQTTTVHPSYESVETVHLHRGLTRLVWKDRETVELRPGISAVFSRQATPDATPGWLLSLESTHSTVKSVMDRCPEAFAPSKWNASENLDRTPQHADHLVYLGDFELGCCRADAIRRHSREPMRVSRRRGDGDVIVMRLD